MTEAELTELPRWAKVALAARCARRSLPIFRRWQCTLEQADTLDQAIRAAECAAAVATADRRAISAKRDAAREVLNEVTYAANDLTQSSLHALAASMAAARAAETAIAANYNNAHSLCVLTQAAVNAAANAGVSVRGDLEKLTAMASLNHWNDATAVPAEVFESDD